MTAAPERSIISDVRAAARLAWAQAGLVPPAVVVLATAGTRVGELSWQAFAVTVVALAPAVVLGLLLAVRRAGHSVAPLLVALGLVPLLVLALEAWGATVEAGRPWPGAYVAGVLAAGAWAWFYAPPAALALVFPTGRLLGPRWRPAAVGVVVAPLLVHLTEVLIPAGFAAAGSPGPVLLPGPLRVAVVVAGLGGLLAVLVACAAALVVRYRGGDRIVRRQLRWTALVAVLVPVVLVTFWVSTLVFGSLTPGVLLGLGALAALPVTVAVAILRHDLYDIDRLLSRTVGWAVVSAVLVALFLAVAVGAGVLLGRDSAVVAALATLACAVAFAPVRRSVQQRVDRIFDRDRHLALAAVGRFVDQVRDGEAEPEHIEDVLRRALPDSDLALAYRLPADGGAEVVVDAAGEVVSSPTGPRILQLDVAGHGLALVTYGPRSAERPALLHDVLREAHLPIEVARLRLGQRRSLAETAASRARLLRTADEERRRLERDLHDGAQQRLVALGMALRSAQRRLPPDDAQAAVLDDGVRQLQEAVAELRRIAQGLRPRGLDDGLPAAIRTLVRRCPVPVDLAITDAAIPEHVATAAYYVAAEAVANALKHAGANRLHIDIGATDGSLHVTITDDGRGGAPPIGSASMHGLGDRVAAAGGRLRVDSPRGAGTTVEAVLPCGS